MGQHPGAVQPLPPEAVVGQAVVLAPADLDREEVFQPGLLDQLGQVPGIAEDVGQPQHGRNPVAKMAAEERLAQQELARQGFRPADVAVCLDPHAAQWFPAPLRHPRFDLAKESRVIPAHKLIKLGLALGKMIGRKLLHQPQDGGKGTPCLAPCLPHRPQPGQVEVGVARGRDRRGMGGAGGGDSGLQ